MISRRGFIKGVLATAGVGGGLAVGARAFMRLPRFGRLPQGDRMERILASPNYRNGAFRNLPSAYVPPFRPDDGRGGVRSSLFNKEKLRLVPKLGEIPVVKSDLHALVRESDAFVWFGHSSYFLQLGGIRILVDPVFNVASPISFLMGEPFPGTDIYRPEDIPDVDVLLITHDH